RFGVRAAYFYVDVTAARLNKITELFDSGKLVTDVGTVLPLEEASIAREFSDGPSPLCDRITVGGIECLLGFLQDFELEQFIFSSGEVVHAPSELGQRINEDAPFAAKWPYPESKVKTERVIHTGRRP